MEQAEQRRKPGPGESRNMLKAENPKSPSSHPRTLSTFQAPFSREMSKLRIYALEIIWGNFTQTSVFPSLGFSGERIVFLDSGISLK